jgi:hypothetical protein
MPGALHFVMDLEGQGTPIASILLMLVAPAARLVRESWLCERSTFLEATAALRVLRELIDELRAGATPTPSDPTERE